MAAMNLWFRVLQPHPSPIINKGDTILSRQREGWRSRGEERRPGGGGSGSELEGGALGEEGSEDWEARTGWDHRSPIPTAIITRTREKERAGRRAKRRERSREEIFTFPPHAHFEALLEAAVLALVAVVLVDGTVPVGTACRRRSRLQAPLEEPPRLLLRAPLEVLGPELESGPQSKRDPRPGLPAPPLLSRREPSPGFKSAGSGESRAGCGAKMPATIRALGCRGARSRAGRSQPFRKAALESGRQPARKITHFALFVVRVAPGSLCLLLSGVGVPLASPPLDSGERKSFSLLKRYELPQVKAKVNGQAVLKRKAIFTRPRQPRNEVKAAQVGPGELSLGPGRELSFSVLSGAHPWRWGSLPNPNPKQIPTLASPTGRERLCGQGTRDCIGFCTLAASLQQAAGELRGAPWPGHLCLAALLRSRAQPRAETRMRSQRV
ncbi:hypothetical protein NN561_006417 [Cricetulus griseus]